MEPGLDQADALKPGQGWVAGKLDAGKEKDTSLTVEAGLKVNPNLALFGDAWYEWVKNNPDKFGGDVGARIGGKLDLFAGGWGDTSGGWGSQAGVKFHF